MKMIHGISTASFCPKNVTFELLNLFPSDHRCEGSILKYFKQLIS